MKNDDDFCSLLYLKKVSVGDLVRYYPHVTENEYFLGLVLNFKHPNFYRIVVWQDSVCTVLTTKKIHICLHK